MKNWFICKIKYPKQDNSGKLRTISEQYLFDAVSFTEAETKAYQTLGESIPGEFAITNISKTNITDVFFYEDSDVWHKCKMTYTLEVEGAGKEKVVNNFVLLTAPNVKEAYDRMCESFNNMLIEFQVPEIVQSPILEVYPN